MKLKIFEKGQSYGATLGIPVMSINRKSGAINMNRMLGEKLNVKVGQRLLIAQDEENPKSWYMCIGTDERGFNILSHNNGKKNGAGLYCCNSKCVNAICDTIKVKNSATLLVSLKPIELDGEKWYQIMTAKPVKID